MGNGAGTKLLVLCDVPNVHWAENVVYEIERYDWSNPLQFISEVIRRFIREEIRRFISEVIRHNQVSYGAKWLLLLFNHLPPMSVYFFFLFLIALID